MPVILDVYMYGCPTPLSLCLPRLKMTRLYSYFFTYLTSNPDPNKHPKLWEHRGRQRRPLFKNPFVSEESPLAALINSSSTMYVKQGRDSGAKKHLDLEYGERPSTWLSLFYDLAWTATFASLVENSQFKNPWDAGSYVVFFTTVWWMWVSQVLYTVEYYSDDWMHLLSTFAQLIIFGIIAATTKDFDVTAFIQHTPGSTKIESDDKETMTPEVYLARRLAFNSIKVITVAIAASRLISISFKAFASTTLHPRRTTRSSGSSRIPLRLFVIPASLLISTTLFFAAYGVCVHSGRTSHGAQVKWVLWGVALLVEMVAHTIKFQMRDGPGLKVRSHGSVVERFCSITVIIIGEGVNSMATSFYSLEQAPGFINANGGNIFCCALIVFLLAYLYFEGPVPLQPVRRRLSWCFVHLLWLLSLTLLLHGLKSQYMLLNFLTSIDATTEILNAVTNDTSQDLATFKPRLSDALLQGGQSYATEWPKFEKMLEDLGAARNNSEATLQVANVWVLREAMEIALNMFLNFLNNDTISDSTWVTIDQYRNNYSFTLQDALVPSYQQKPILAGIYNDLVGPSIIEGRYIMAMCGGTLVSLATLNLIQSWPRDRFLWGSIISRYAIGIIMIFLLLLNIGHDQTYFIPEGSEAAVLNWIGSALVIPTLALAYLVQFLIDTVRPLSLYEP
ncbi:hypothetical protein FRC12_005538 [Ceratobasidium sp. 428]|nr:hypothetical protein FRC12_005538 [Ceratobasidium sp. 428]